MILRLILLGGFIGALASCGDVTETSSTKNSSIKTVSAAAREAREQDVALAQSLVEICADKMPNVPAAQQAFAEAGMRYEGIVNGFKLYSANGFRVVSATSQTIAADDLDFCTIAVSKMSAEKAQSVIAPWLERANAKPIKPWNSSVNLAWEGRYKGSPVRLGINEEIRLGVMRGAAIFAAAREAQ